MKRNLISLAAASLLVAAGASASPSYPLFLQDELKLDTTPSCTICHVGTTGSGTVNTELGKALRARGLVGGSNEASLRNAIKALVAEGNPAIKPYANGGAVVNTAGPEYGCSYRAATSAGSAWVSAIGVCVAFAWARRRRG